MIWLWLFFLKSSISEYSQVEILKTDTIYVNKPYKEVVIKQVEIQKPVKVFVYKTDTLYRQRLEKDTLISAVYIESKKATIHTITPKGTPLVRRYPLEDHKNITINHQGDLQQIKKKKRREKLWRNLERTTIFISGLYLGSKIQN